jgi:hypothetical protein
MFEIVLYRNVPIPPEGGRFVPSELQAVWEQYGHLAAELHPEQGLTPRDLFDVVALRKAFSRSGDLPELTPSEFFRGLAALEQARLIRTKVEQLEEE